METYEQKKRRLFGKLDLPKYMEELNRLMKINITEKDLLSIVDSDKFIETHRRENPPVIKETIPFDRKDLLKEILEKNIPVWDKPFIFFSDYSRDCGLLRIPSLHCFNLNFQFYDEHSGFFTFTSEDGKEDIYFDCDEEFGKEFLAIELYKKE